MRMSGSVCVDSGVNDTDNTDTHTDTYTNSSDEEDDEERGFFDSIEDDQTLSSLCRYSLYSNRTRDTEESADDDGRAAHGPDKDGRADEEDQFLINSRPLFPPLPRGRSSTLDVGGASSFSDTRTRSVSDTGGSDRHHSELNSARTIRPNFGVNLTYSYDDGESFVPIEEGSDSHSESKEPTGNDAGHGETPASAESGAYISGIYSRLKKAVLSPSSEREAEGTFEDDHRGRTISDSTPSRHRSESSVRVSLFSKRRFTPFGVLSIAQQVRAHQGAIWTAEFSLDGKYLATGGRDGRVIVWSVGIDRRGVSDDDLSPRHRAPGPPHVPSTDATEVEVWSRGGFSLLHPSPCRVYSDHTDDVVALSWTKKHFLLSASADKTVRLWNVRRVECLRVIEHPDLLSSVTFHPLSERFLVTGCMDGHVRVYDLLKEDTKETAWVEAHDIVTAVCFSPDGAYVVAGFFDGHVFIYEFPDLKYYTQIACLKRKKRGKMNQLGRKVTGLHFIRDGATGTGVETGPRRAAMSKSWQSLLVTTNDSRIRLFNMSDFTQIAKFKGLSNNSRQIRASGSVDGRTIICGSDTGEVFLWRNPCHRQDSGGGGDGRYIKSLYTPSKSKTCGMYATISSEDGGLNSSGISACIVAQFVPMCALRRACLNDFDKPFGEHSESNDNITDQAIISAGSNGTISIFYNSFSEFPIT